MGEYPATVKLDALGRVTIPAPIREALGVGPGDLVVIRVSRKPDPKN